MNDVLSFEDQLICARFLDCFAVDDAAQAGVVSVELLWSDNHGPERTRSIETLACAAPLVHTAIHGGTLTQQPLTAVLFELPVPVGHVVCNGVAKDLCNQLSALADG